jgi:Icc-related predicted phosphoesterase
MDCSLKDSAFNTMDLRHPEYVHSGLFGFGNNIPPKNIKHFFYSKDKVGLSFDYVSKSNIQALNGNTKFTKNYHMYIYPSFSWSKVSFDESKHLIIGGNHDNYDIFHTYPHFLSDYGYVVDFNGIDFFYYRGAYSIDRQYRTIGIDWWANEEVKIEGFMKARELYRQIKPDIMITHDCPEFMVLQYIGANARVYQNSTNWALNELYNIHQPKIWIHGHYHVSKTTVYGDTKFVCLNELETFKLSQV